MMTSLQKPLYCDRCKNKHYAFDIDKDVNKYYKILIYGYVHKYSINHIPDVIVAICLYFFYYFIQQSQSKTYNTFEEMGLKKDLILAINQCGLNNTCTHKQVGIVPIIQLRDVILMQYHSTHTCKSAITTYIIGILQRINVNASQCQAIILSPTKELATQIKIAIYSLNKYLKATTEMYVDDANIDCLSNNIQIIISTPPLINNILSKNNLKLNTLKILLMNGIDEMLSLGLEDTLSNILKYLPSDMQFITTASTANREQTTPFTNKFMSNPLAVNFETNVDETFESFDHMNLNENILRGVYAYGFEKPSRIQQHAIVPIIKKYDVLAQAQSGTGKTATYCIAALQIVDLNDSQCQVLTIIPTRELSQSVRHVCKSLGCYLTNLTTCACVGGTSIRQDINSLINGVQMVFGTPGRITGMIARGALTLNKLKLLILDEMDEMFSRGFKEQIIDCYQYTPPTTQVAVLSATMPNELLKLVGPWMTNPAYIFVKKKELSLDGLKQYYVAVEKEDYKLATLYDLFDIWERRYQAVVYCNTRRKVMWLMDKCCKHRDIFSCTINAMHGEMYATERASIVKEFREGENGILITTDLLARGVNLESVSLIINFDLPMNRENYIYRVGTKENIYQNKIIAISFVTDDDETKLRDIETFYDTKIDELPMDIEGIMCQHPNHEMLLQ